MHRSSIPRSAPEVKRVLPAALFVLLAFALALLGAAANTLAGVIRFKDLERDALLILSDWQSIDALTNDVLLKRVSLSDGGASRLLSEWERRTLDFSLSLARFNDDRRLAPLGGLEDEVEGAVALWIATEGRISSAQRSIRSMIRSGLASRVLVNGFLQTFYQLRMERLLSRTDILAVDEAIAALEILDTTTEEFDGRLRAVVDRVGSEVGRRIVGIGILSAFIAAAAAVGIVAGAFSWRSYRRTEKNRRTERERLRRDYLGDLFLKTDPASRAEAERALRGLGCALPFAPGLVLCVLRFDRPADGAPPPLDRLIAAASSAPGPEREAFAAAPDTLAVLVSSGGLPGDAASRAALDFLAAVRAAAAVDGASLSAAVGNRFGPGTDRSAVLEDLLSIFSYRYLLGPGVILRACDLPAFPETEYAYPAKAEEMLNKRILEADAAGAKEVLARMLDEASAYPPAVARAAVARTAAALFAAVERLERAADLVLPSASAELLAELPRLDTLAAARERCLALLDELGAASRARRADRAAETAARADALIAAEYADPNLSAELIADRLGLSAGYFTRGYRKATGRSAADAVNEARCAAAARLLRDSDLTVEAVAAAVGIPNPGSFYRLFKARYGVTPNEARMKAAGA